MLSKPTTRFGEGASRRLYRAITAVRFGATEGIVRDLLSPIRNGTTRRGIRDQINSSAAWSIYGQVALRLKLA